MALASALLKHYAIAKLTPTPWSSIDAHLTRDTRGKPVYTDPATHEQPVAFNVSHQDGVVVLVAVAHYPADYGTVEVGVDVVSTTERRGRDLEMVGKGEGGWREFVDMHADVLAPGEVRRLKELRPAFGLGEQRHDGQLRAFYALWALREAYVKLTGEALLAEWLRELEFRDCGPPRPTAAWEVPADEAAGELLRLGDVWFKGKRVEDVKVCLGSVGPGFMIATAVRTPGNAEDGLGWKLGLYEELSLEEVLGFARASG